MVQIHTGAMPLASQRRNLWGAAIAPSHRGSRPRSPHPSRLPMRRAEAGRHLSLRLMRATLARGRRQERPSLSSRQPPHRPTGNPCRVSWARHLQVGHSLALQRPLALWDGASHPRRPPWDRGRPTWPHHLWPESPGAGARRPARRQWELGPPSGTAAREAQARAGAWQWLLCSKARSQPAAPAVAPVGWWPRRPPRHGASLPEGQGSGRKRRAPGRHLRGSQAWRGRGRRAQRPRGQVRCQISGPLPPARQQSRHGPWPRHPRLRRPRPIPAKPGTCASKPWRAIPTGTQQAARGFCMVVTDSAQSAA
mmetsp:Transcript_30231/g.96556  ORF Transcript_30231/g.96556 Transcript_30231/m.96556 type:complete len:309 (+) Transcript_30231:2223-3149(+)